MRGVTGFGFTPELAVEGETRLSGAVRSGFTPALARKGAFDERPRFRKLAVVTSTRSRGRADGASSASQQNMCAAQSFGAETAEAPKTSPRARVRTSPIVRPMSQMFSVGWK